jgi:pilus assembly protein Flp/PilA
MRNKFLKLYVKAKVMVDMLKDESGQDLVEYAAVIALVVLAATAGMQTLANGINAAMGSLSTQINSQIG